MRRIDDAQEGWANRDYALPWDAAARAALARLGYDGQGEGRAAEQTEQTERSTR